MTGIAVLKPGLHTMVQDMGRRGYGRYGVPVCGPMDTVAFRAANALAGNDANEAGLEIVIRGPQLRFREERVIAVCGADISFRVNDEPQPTWRPVYVPKDALVTFGSVIQGVRAYLAVNGGIDVPEVLHSKSTALRSGWGGLHGRTLQEGDHLKVGSSSMRSIQQLIQLREHWLSSNQLSYSVPWSVSYTIRPQYAPHPTLRVIPGQEYEWFGSQACLLTTQSFKVTAQSDRMGYRLEGEQHIRLSSPKELLSEAVSMGTVQVPHGGNPIVLMADHQTTGGYPRMAHVISVDLPLLAQVMPGADIQFELVSISDAQRLLLQWEHKWEQCLVQLHRLQKGE